jgi:hypothetical protein
LTVAVPPREVWRGEEGTGDDQPAADLVVRLLRPPQNHWVRYRVAGLRVLSDTELPPLATVERSSGTSPEIDPPGEDEWRTGRKVFDGVGWLAGGRQRVTCWQTGSGLWLWSEGGPRRWVATGGRRMGVPGSVEGRVAAARDLVLGPGLPLALAWQDVFCLHASAVVVDGKVVALLGASGSGKSTLAAALPQGWGQRIADDVLPVECGGGPAEALPHYPQLKLAPEAQYPPHAPERRLLAGVFLLAEGDSVRIEQLRQRDATLALLRNTVASRLLPPDLLARHLDASARLARAAPVRRLSYPRRRGVLSAVWEAARREVD